MFRWTKLAAPLAALLITGLVVPAAHAATPRDCATTLDCTTADIDAMSITDRLTFVRDMESGPAQRIAPGFAQWRNIEGVLEFFIDHGWGASGTWVSDVDDGILTGAERGLAIALGMGTDTYGNPGAPKWAGFLTQLRAGQLTDRAAHDHAWGDAEQTSTDWGTTVAAQLGHEPTDVQSRWFQFTQVYRFMLMNRPAALDEINRLGATVPFYDWATDVTTDMPSHQGGEAFYQLVSLNVIYAGESTILLFDAYIPVLFTQWLADTGRG